MKDIKRYDQFFLCACVALLFIGLMTLFSLGLAKSNPNWFYKQSFHVFLAIGVFIVASYRPVNWWRRYAPWFAAIAIVLLFLSLPFVFGSTHKGASRWISFASFTIQPVEFFKFSFLLICARYCARAASTKRGFDMILPIIGWLLLPVIMIILQPDLGSFVLISTVTITMLFLAGLRLKWIFLVFFAIALVVAVSLLFKDYQLGRFYNFWDPFDDRYGSDYNVVQSLMAYARGGFMGVGIGNIVAGRDLPEAHNDFIIAVIAEEHGFFGFIAVFLILLFVLSRIAYTGYRAKIAKDMFGSFYAFGLATLLALQMIINIGGSLALLPVKGLTLPLLSYGGSSMLSVALMLGVLTSIDYESQQIRMQHL